MIDASWVPYEQRACPASVAHCGATWCLPFCALQTLPLSVRRDHGVTRTNCRGRGEPL